MLFMVHYQMIYSSIIYYIVLSSASHPLQTHHLKVGASPIAQRGRSLAIELRCRVLVHLGIKN